MSPSKVSKKPAKSNTAAKSNTPAKAKEKPKFLKARTGCYSCKQRKKKCDEVKPICSTCQRLNLPCSYLKRYQWHKNHQMQLDKKDLKSFVESNKKIYSDYLVNEHMKSLSDMGIINPYIINTTMASQKGVGANVDVTNKFYMRFAEMMNNHSTDYTVHFINVTRWDVSLAYHFSANDTLAEDLLPKFHYESLLPEFELKQMFEMNGLDDNDSLNIAGLGSNTTGSSPSSVSLYRDSIIKSYGLDKQFLFDYYQQRLVNKNINSCKDSSNNEFKSIIIQTCEKSKALYYSVLAFSAQSLLKDNFYNSQTRNSNEHLSICYYLTFKYKNLSINYLHDILDNMNFEMIDIKVYEELLITIIMLCSLDINYTGNIGWVNHLKESCLLFSAIPVDELAKILKENKLLLFAYKYFALRYILLISTMKGNHLKIFLYTSTLPIIKEIFDSDTIDHMFGCSPRLLYMLYDLAMMDYNDSTLQKSETDSENGISSNDSDDHHMNNDNNDLHDCDNDNAREKPKSKSGESSVNQENRLYIKYSQFWNELTNLQQYLSARDSKSQNLLLVSKAYHLSLKIYFINLLIINKRIRYFMIRSKIDFLSMYYNQLFPETLQVLEEIMKLQVSEELKDFQRGHDGSTILTCGNQNGNNSRIGINSPETNNSTNNTTNSTTPSTTESPRFGESSMPLLSSSPTSVITLFPMWSLLVLSILVTNINNSEKEELIRLKILRVLKFLEIRDPLSSIFRLKRAIGIVWKVTDLSNSNNKTSATIVDEDDDENAVDNLNATSSLEYTAKYNYKFDWRDILIEAGFSLALT